MNVPAKQEHAQPVVQPPSSQGLALNQSPLIPRIQLAKMFPREVEVFKVRLRAEATADPTGLVYRKPQSGGHLLGPSVRLAEIAARLFGNLHVGLPEIEEHDGRVTATVEALDLETNVSVPGVSTTSLVDKKGHRLRADLVSNLITASAAKARRNAVFAIIGKAVFDDLVGACLAAEKKIIEVQQESERKSGRTGEIWAKHVAGWKKAGVSEADLLRSCGVATAADVTPSMLINLNAAVQSVKEGIPARVALGLENDEAPAASAAIEALFDGDGGDDDSEEG